MISIMSLWLPVLVSAVGVFIVSSVIHTFLKYHANDFVKLGAEDAYRSAVRSLDIPPGEYMVPRMTHEEMKDPANMEKFKQGPVALITVLPNEVPNMARSLSLWFAYCVAVSVFAAYVAGRTLTAGADGMMVFRIAGTVAFAGYALALFHDSIWFERKWSTTWKFVFDGLVYALLTGAVFSWLWPTA